MKIVKQSVEEFHIIKKPCRIIASKEQSSEIFNESINISKRHLWKKMTSIYTLTSHNAIVTLNDILNNFFLNHPVPT